MRKRKTIQRKNTIKALCIAVMVMCIGATAIPLQTQAATKATSVTASQTAYILKVGQTISLKATLKPSKVSVRKVTWKSSAPKVAKVSASGKVKALKPGKTTITVSTKDGSKKKDTVKITVKKTVKKISKIKITNKTKTVMVGKTLTLKTSITPSKASLKTLKYTSSNTAIATVSEKGVVKAMKTGTVTIKAEAQDGSRKKTTIKIKVTPILVTKIALSQTTMNLKTGESGKLTAVAVPSNAANKGLQWASSKVSVATVSNGTIKAVSAGTATITVKSTDGSGKYASCQVSVTDIPVTDVRLSAIYMEQTAEGNYTLTTYVDRTKSIQATITPANATKKELIWYSSDSSIVKVNQQGVIEGKKVGTATITATNGLFGDVKASCVVTVKEAIQDAANHQDFFYDYYLNLKDTTYYRVVRDDTITDVSASRFAMAQLALGTIFTDAAGGADAFYQLLKHAQSGDDILSFAGNMTISNVGRTQASNGIYETISFTLGTGSNRRTITCTQLVETTGTRDDIKDASMSSGKKSYPTKSVRFKANVENSTQTIYMKIEMVEGNGSIYLYVSDLESVVSAQNAATYLSVMLENNEITKEVYAQQFHISVDKGINDEIKRKYPTFPDFRYINFYNIYSDYSKE